MRTRIVHTKLWEDNFVSELSIAGKLVFLYLLTNSRVNLIHCYECSDRQIMFDTGVSKITLDKLKDEFQTWGKVYFYDGYVYLANADNYEEFTGEKNETAKESLNKQLRDNVRNWLLTCKNTPIDTGIMIPPINHNKEIINKKSKDKEFELSDDEIKKLDDKFPLKAVSQEIEKAQNYCAYKGKTYKDYYKFMVNWLFDKPDVKKPKQEFKPPDVKPASPEVIAEFQQKKKEMFGL